MSELIKAHLREISHPDLPHIEVYPDVDTVAKAAAGMMADIVRTTPTARITFATGNTMVPVYGETAALAASGDVDFSQVTAFHLDEYFPMPADRPESFVGYIQERVVEPFGISPDKALYLDGTTNEPHAEAARYEALLAGGVDVAIIGIGPGCHIAFNESGSSFDSRTRLVDLAQETVTRNQGRGETTPAYALSQGIANILEARRIILVAHGREKAEYVRKALMDPISQEVPASALRLIGERVTIVLDEAAASLLK